MCRQGPSTVQGTGDSPSLSRGCTGDGSTIARCSHVVAKHKVLGETLGDTVGTRNTWKL